MELNLAGVSDELRDRFAGTDKAVSRLADARTSTTEASQ
jgi:hypothetical protein